MVSQEVREGDGVMMKTGDRFRDKTTGKDSLEAPIRIECPKFC
jgi:hypothetical protein